LQKGHKDQYRTADTLKPAINRLHIHQIIEVQAWRQDRYQTSLGIGLIS
jgi:hypothetical protein